MKLKNKKLTSLLILLSFISYMPLSTTMASAVDMNMPNLNNSMNGSVSVNGNQMNVNVIGGAGAVGQFDWNSFNVAKGNNVNFGFTNNSQTSLNRVLATGGLSQIYGSLTNSCVGGDCSSYMGTGKVILINPAGIMFGPGSSVDLNSFTATTFDLKGAKNLKDMSPSELAAYKKSFDIKVNGDPSDLVMKAEFVGNQNNTAVTLDGTNFKIDKSLALAGNNVNIYKDSLIKTNLAYNYGGGQNPANHNQSFSNVKIVTSDGVNFNYQLNGNINGVAAKADSAAGKNTARNINIDGATIESGSVYIQNTGSKAGNDVNIKNSVVKGMKLVSTEYGDIYIKSANDVNVENSDLVTYNTTKSNGSATTKGSNGGRIMINAGKNATIKNSNLVTAYSTNNHSNTPGSNAGDVSVLANNGNVTITDTNVLSKGNVLVAAAGKVNIKDSALQSKNLGNKNLKKTIEVTGSNGVTIDNTYTESAGDTTFYSPKTVDVKNGSTVYADGNLNIHGADTTIADSALVYNNLSFIKDGLINNVTIKGATSLLDKGTPDTLKLTTNGNLTVDNSELLQRGFTSKINDDTYEVTVTMGEAANQNAIALESTKGKVTIKNNSDIKTAGNITVNANDTANGEIFVQNSKLTSSANNIALNQAKTHIAGTHITKDSTLNAKNIAITTKNSDADIIADQDNFANLNYTERLALNAGRDNIITGSKAGGLNINNVDFNAGRNNSVNYNTKNSTSASNVLNVTNSKFNANGNNVLATNGTLTLNDVTLNGATNDLSALYDINLNTVNVLAKNTATPENTKTVVRAGDSVRTNGKILNMNQTKLIADSNKDMNLVLAGVANKKAGIEINAQKRDNSIPQDSIINKTGDVQLRDLKDTKVTINAADDVLAISKIKSGSLNLDKNDSFLAALTDLTASEIEGVTGNTSGKAYIEVANWGQFNLDPMETFDDFYNQPDSFTYTDHFVKGQYQPEAGSAIDTYKKHFIEFNTNGSMEQFLLVYEKPVSGCEPPPVVNPDPFDPFAPSTPSISDDLSSLIEQMRLPRQLEPTSRVAPIANNTTDPTSGIVNAAARIEVVDVDQNLQAVDRTTGDKDEYQKEFEI